MLAYARRHSPYNPRLSDCRCILTSLNRKLPRKASKQSMAEVWKQTRRGHYKLAEPMYTVRCQSKPQNTNRNSIGGSRAIGLLWKRVFVSATWCYRVRQHRLLTFPSTAGVCSTTRGQDWSGTLVCCCSAVHLADHFQHLLHVSGMSRNLVPGSAS